MVAVDGVSLSVRRNQVLGVVGESGSGKSVTTMAVARLLPRNARIDQGAIWLTDGAQRTNVLTLDANGRAMNAIRGGQVGVVFQEPMGAFSPVHTIGNQLVEAIRLHRHVGEREAKAIALDLLTQVGITAPVQRLGQYAFELSGGMRQRAMIAMALAGDPSLLIADEPTTALDVTLQAQILALFKHVQAATGMGIIFITHDLGVVAQMADDIVVMYLGKIVERAPVKDLFARPAHPYTRNLLRSVTRMGDTRQRMLTIPGNLPNPFDRPRGCPFHPRCTEMVPGVCDRESPPTVALTPQHSVSCVLFQARRDA